MRDRLENYINLENKRYRLLVDIDILNRRKEEYEPSILNSGIGGARSSGTSTPTENAALKSIAFFDTIDREIKIKRKQLAEVERELEFLNQYISDIPDLQLQEAIRLHYTQDVKWNKIAVMWFYSPNSVSSIQKRVYDYLNQTDYT